LVVDQTARQNYINQRTLAKKALESTDNLQAEMSNMKQELSELKEMLRVLIGRSNTDK
jgi:hypothetical protein